MKIADKVSFENSLKLAVLTGLVEGGSKVTNNNEKYIVNLRISNGKINVKLLPYESSC